MSITVALLTTREEAINTIKTLIATGCTQVAYTVRQDGVMQVSWPTPTVEPVKEKA